MDFDPNCVFCQKQSSDFVIEGDLCVAFWDIHPVSKGHLLIVPKRHVAQIWDATASEKKELGQMAEDAKKLLDKQFKPDGYNVSINSGAAAGQSVFHCHIHLIPRYWNKVTKGVGAVPGQFLVPKQRPEFK
ncbi:Diadenosine tetraphosphate (Ap4A) hydrolase related HIT family hydrolase [Pediococcus damnosus]|uniref:Diadenosine tetraphosphate (Ap4A) hydrolase related HIT family hydrolase n=1 Tax=Pediococcus damnosus TaxID=51663 RepID=A0A143AZK7_9LACO|nr:HIT family protein [Pediococcus damnosus]AMV60531.1 Diadenosine tetraphosphate (Ap4A) hydrolase related HIT family hydrolase [Pediococcus damnosus]AMV63004.1 Diadenosine tetraphosphate (Ap4A) hydrolase related HIT family hydrolase [Pediococcus damnosus]AMV67109.1 Diadenosine tetraphosphate (Ap4A) hydrolase related HIT family hydrolase [Pediococcus damnosus]AMV69289.1 Diadenosine tetraphosphate (Ap4A) hydrolase related HIT family hydrolase [Pediococcus damnosus]KJU74780.1 HIT family hydrolas